MAYRTERETGLLARLNFHLTVITLVVLVSSLSLVNAACPVGFIASPSPDASCFALSMANVSFDKAHSQCQALNSRARVAWITSNSSNTFIRSRICNASQTCWIGLKRAFPCSKTNASDCGGDQTCACAFKWVDTHTGSQTYVYRKSVLWMPTRPKYRLSGCVVTTAMGWDDVSCTIIPRPTVCQGQ
jgi:hypothetical protein